MRILVGNNYHYLRGGAERVYFEHMKLLESNGHQVIPFSIKDPEAEVSEFDEYFVEPVQYDARQGLVKKTRVAVRIIYSFHSKRKAQAIARATKPDVAHFHNIYHRLNPSVLPVFRRLGVPTFVTAHDYKLLCPIYLLYRDGQVCELCSRGVFSNCLRYKCNRGSGLLSLVGTLEGYLQKIMRIWKNNITRVITPSAFLRKKLIENRFNAEQVVHIRNFVRLEVFKPNYDHEGYFLYFGRLSREKGLKTLLRAFTSLKTSFRLVLAGDGPMRNELERLAGSDGRVVFTGYLVLIQKPGFSG